MQVKLLEVRDRATFMPCMAIRLDPSNEADRYLLARAGYGNHESDQCEYVLFGKIAGGEDLVFQCDPFLWNSRTMQTAHVHAVTKWDELTSGDVVDVEYILGERQERKISERLES